MGYNINMSIGIFSSDNAYINTSLSAYKTAKTASVEQENSDAVKSTKTKPNDDIKDTVTISDEAMNLYKKDRDSETQTSTETSGTTSSTQNFTDEKTAKTQSNEKLTKAEEAQVKKLKEIDAKVKAHEQAHEAAAAGLNASAPTYSYETGPDGAQYAVAGEVSINFVPSKDPDENIRKAETMRAAALAPADPSSQDRAVANEATQIIAKAESEKQQEKTDDKKSEDTENTEDKTTDNSKDTIPTSTSGVSSTSTETSPTSTTDNLQNQSAIDSTQNSTIVEQNSQIDNNNSDIQQNQLPTQNIIGNSVAAQAISSKTLSLG